MNKLSQAVPQKAMRRVSKFQVCAYQPEGEQYPVLCIQVLLPGYGPKFGRYLSPVIRRADAGYLDVLTAAKGDVYWLYGQSPKSLM